MCRRQHTILNEGLTKGLTEGVSSDNTTCFKGLIGTVVTVIPSILRLQTGCVTHFSSYRNNKTERTG